MFLFIFFCYPSEILGMRFCESPDDNIIAVTPPPAVFSAPSACAVSSTAGALSSTAAALPSVLSLLLPHPANMADAHNETLIKIASLFFIRYLSFCIKLFSVPEIPDSIKHCHHIFRTGRTLNIMDRIKYITAAF